MISNTEINNLLATAIKAALRAGKVIIEVYNSDDFQVKQKSDNTPLTLADRNAHNEIVKLLEKTNFPVLSEEGKNIPYNKRKKWKYFWLVDPLDGTKEFIKQNGEFTVNIAFIYQQKPIMGVIYVPVLEELYIASDSLGAYKIDEISIDKSEKLELNYLLKRGKKLPVQGLKDKFTIIGSRSHKSKETDDFINDLKAKYNDIEIITCGSSIKLCMIAEGKADIYPRFAPTMEWDTAAGHSIVLAAGGSVTKQDGVTLLEYNKEDLLNPWFIVKAKSRSEPSG